MEANARHVLDAAWTAGIRYFDAARSYGLGEAFLGDWLEKRAIPPPAVSVGSKWGYTYTADWRVDAEVHEVKEHSAAVLESASLVVDTPAARLIARGEERLLLLDEVEALLASKALVVDACRHVVRDRVLASFVAPGNGS